MLPLRVVLVTYNRYPRVSRSRVAFLTQFVKLVCPSFCPRVWFGCYRVTFCSHRDSFVSILFFHHPRYVNIGTVWRGQKASECRVVFPRPSGSLVCRSYCHRVETIPASRMIRISSVWDSIPPLTPKIIQWMVIDTASTKTQTETSI